ncbi:RING finger protein 215 isoform X2 [Numida meleagris]|uniref:RING finger protein 215 isoform X2 n=1 Tax=Numida meleagris TaxID=8996 RepID=UPI000B3E2832|nr:RING finger protein 215 isoform X2 [Numida meleagris]
MAALRAALLAPLLALSRAGPGPAPSARVEVALSGPGDADGDGAGTAAGPGGSYTLRGALLGAAGGGSGLGRGAPREVEIGGRLVLVGDAEPELGAADSWIGVVPVGEEPTDSPRSTKEESFTAAVVSKMKRALVLGASALLILALNQNAIREVGEPRSPTSALGALLPLSELLLFCLVQLDVSQLLAKPVIVIQSSDNVTRLLGALLRGLRATAKITYQAVLLENLGVTLTLWSTCGLSRGGLYGEWQGVICTGENSSQVQKYLQQLWNTILLVALLLCTGVIVQAQRQSRQGLSERDAELDLKQHIRRRLLALKTRRYHPGKALRSRACEIDSCAVCLDQFCKSQWLRVLPCSHEFHRDCVDPWLLLQQTCPLCKHNILGNCCGES